jgi:hypothetical protein
LALYGRIEHSYCEPVADALVNRADVVSYLLKAAGSPAWNEPLRCLNKEQAKMRKGKFWWKNAYSNACTCPGLHGREIDIAAVFERECGDRIGLHIECKNPADKFHNGQSESYAIRKTCWAKSGSCFRTLPKHHDTVIILLCNRINKHSVEDTRVFDAMIFFDQLSELIPDYPPQI